MTSVYVTVKSKKLCNDFSLCVNQSGFAKVTDTFSSFRECKKKLAERIPDILLLALDLTDGYWVDFCEEVRNNYPSVKILVITTYDEYCVFKNALNSLTSGYISKDALPNVIVAALRSAIKGDFFRYDKMAVPVEAEASNPHTSLAMIQETARNISDTDNDLIITDKLTKLIAFAEEYRLQRIKKLINTQKDKPDEANSLDYLTLGVEKLLLKGHDNWEIAEMLNIHIETVRLCRMELILKIRGDNSMIVNISEKEKPVMLARREYQILRLLAAGYSYKEIAYKCLYVEYETVNTIGDQLRRKFDADNVMVMVIKALRMGLIKLEDIDSLMT